MHIEDTQLTDSNCSNAYARFPWINNKKKDSIHTFTDYYPIAPVKLSVERRQLDF